MHTLAELDESRTNELLKGTFIPSSPKVLTELMEELRSPMTNGKKLAALINKDAGLAAGVLKSVNSPVFGTSRKIDSLPDAINLLGFKTLSNLVLQTLLRTTIRCHDSSLERFWDNSAYTAAVSGKLASVIKGTSADTAYTFGLLHDCGIPLLVQRFSNYKQVLGQANAATDRCFTDVEEELLDTNHAIVGCILARSWGLPDEVSAGILCHHEYAALDGGTHLAESSRALIAINVIAEHVAGIHLRLKEDAEWSKARDHVSHFSGLSLTELDDLIDDMVFRLDSDKNRATA
mgnify:CR=1 FL=1